MNFDPISSTLSTRCGLAVPPLRVFRSVIFCTSSQHTFMLPKTTPKRHHLLTQSTHTTTNQRQTGRSSARDCKPRDGAGGRHGTERRRGQAGERVERRNATPSVACLRPRWKLQGRHSGRTHGPSDRFGYRSGCWWEINLGEWVRVLVENQSGGLWVWLPVGNQFWLWVENQSWLCVLVWLGILSGTE